LTRSRDRGETERSILKAAMEILAEGGHQEFGVNAIARRAGCDKQLIYRYFGGLEGLADAIGMELGVQLTESLKPYSASVAPATYGELMRVLLLALLDILRADPVMQKVVAWEIAAPSSLVSRLVAGRSKLLAAWMHKMRGSLHPPAGVDAPAVNAILIAATQHLVLSGAAQGVFAGLPLKKEADWSRVRDVLSALVTSMYVGAPGADPGNVQKLSRC